VIERVADGWAVVFDLDGLLVESEGAWDAARRTVVADAGGRWRDGASREMLGMSSPEWSRFVHDELGVALAPREIAERVVDQVLAEYRRALPLLPGAVAAVRSLAGHWPLGLASSSNRVVIDEVLRLAELAGLFAATVSSEEVGRGKPAPDVYLAAVSELGVPAPHAVAIEDSSNGLRAARAAGMPVVAVPNREFPPSAEALASANVVLPSLEQLGPETIRSIEREEG
jgi:HAD superfamily hydrolase (TIGR01509 family)